LTTLAITIVASLCAASRCRCARSKTSGCNCSSNGYARSLDWAGHDTGARMTKYSRRRQSGRAVAVSLAETRLTNISKAGMRWQMPPMRHVSGQHQRCAGALQPLTNLCSNGSIDPPPAVAVFARLLDHVKLDPALAQAIRRGDGVDAEKSDPAANNNSRRPGPQPIKLTQPEDLLAVPGFSPEMLDKLKDFVIFLPVVSQINVNTRPARCSPPHSTRSLQPMPLRWW